MSRSPTPPQDRVRHRVYQADLDRFARLMVKTGRSFTLTSLARHWVRGRLRYGPESGEAFPIPVEATMRFWDPREAWQPGDWALFPVASRHQGVSKREPRAGQIVRVMGTALTAQIDGEATPRLWGTPADHDGEGITRWRASLDRHVDRLRDSQREGTQIDYVLFERGPLIMSRIMAALGSDGRFIEWEGEWFLRSLAEIPGAEQLHRLARIMLEKASVGSRLSELLSWLPGIKADDPAATFGYALAMSERPDLFSKVKDGRRIRWSLVSPPPGRYVAKFAVYDPETYEVVCEPDDLLTETEVQRLWQSGLLETAVYGSP